MKAYNDLRGWVELWIDDLTRTRRFEYRQDFELRDTDKIKRLNSEIKVFRLLKGQIDHFLEEGMLEEIYLIKSNIQLLKLVRAATGLGLRSSKDITDKIIEHARNEIGEKYFCWGITKGDHMGIIDESI